MVTMVTKSSNALSVRARCCTISAAFYSVVHGVIKNCANWNRGIEDNYNL